MSATEKINFFRRIGRVFAISVIRYGKDRHSDRAVTLTYFTLFAIVPVAALLFGIAKGFDFEMRLREVFTARFSQHTELLRWIYHFADTTLKQASGGIVAGIGVAALLWTVSWLAASIEGAFNAVWELPPRRNILRKLSDYIAVMLITPILLVVMSSAGVLIRNILTRTAEKLPNPGGCVTFVVALIITLTPVVVSILLFTLIYYLAPNTKVRFGSALFAGVVAGVVFQMFQDGFIYLQKSIFTYNRIYGSFAALPLFLTWLKLSWQLALFGAELSFVEQNIDSGRFEFDPSSGYSISGRNVSRIFLAGAVYRKFSRNGGASTRSELIRLSGLTMAEADVELECLVSSGVIYRIDEDKKDICFTPAKNVDGFTVSDCLELIEKSGVSRSNFNTAAVSEMLEALNASRKNSNSNRKLSEI